MQNGNRKIKFYKGMTLLETVIALATIVVIYADI
jgi:type II secretory pathway pseudopilin PulG